MRCGLLARSFVPHVCSGSCLAHERLLPHALNWQRSAAQRTCSPHFGPVPSTKLRRHGEKAGGWSRCSPEALPVRPPGPALVMHGRLQRAHKGLPSAADAPPASCNVAHLLFAEL